MKQLTIVALMFALVVVLGCAGKEAPPAEEPQTETVADETITEEDFEAGSPEELAAGEAVEEAAEPADEAENEAGSQGQ